MQFLNKKSTQIIVAMVLVIVVFGSGFLFGKSYRSDSSKVEALINKESTLTDKVDFEPFWKVWTTLSEKYVAPDGTTDQDRVWGAIQGLASSMGDPYTVFMPPADAEMFEDDIKGNFGGVGMEIGAKDGFLIVIAPLKDTPAEKAGIKPGDKIIEIDGQSSINFTTDKAVKMIRGEKGTTVNLKIDREGESEILDISIVRDTINIPIVKTEKKGDVFVISLYSFSANSPTLFQDALREFVEYNEKTGADKLVLDLRGNPGGYMEAAVDMASWFLPEGKVVVTEKYRDEGEEKVHRSYGYNIFKEGLKFVILVDGGSASASEILSGALQEHGVAKLVGSQTFGKGSVQELVEITPDTFLKVTVARWYTPNGKSISEDGLTPDVEVERTAKDFEAKKDPQMDKAIEILSK